MWTTSSAYKWIYFHEIKDWRYYLPNLGFYKPSTKTWASKSDLIAEFDQKDIDPYTSDYYSSGPISPNSYISDWFDRSLEVNGLQLFIAAEVGGQKAVPDEWAKKVAQTVKLLTDPNSEGIDIPSQEQMIQILQGATGTWHAGYPTAQRLAYGGGSDYSPNPLTDEGIQSYQATET